MDILVNIAERYGDPYKTFMYDGILFEMPFDRTPEEVIESHWVMNQMMASAQLSSTTVDDVYMNGTMKRQDFAIGTPEGIALVAELQQTWPDYEFNAYPINMVGRYDAHRPPYQNTSISWYNFEEPSAEVLAGYGLTSESYSYRPWYGLKFDLTTNDILLKVVIEESSIPEEQRPVLPDNDKFFARIYNQDGSVDPMVDCYVYASPYTIKAYCEQVGITYPLPDDDEPSNCWIWGIVYNIETLEVTHVKSYIRHSSN